MKGVGNIYFSILLTLLILLPLVMAPVLLSVSFRWRHRLLLFVISIMMLAALYQLTGMDWGSFYFFEGEGAQAWLFKEHAYSNIAAFGFVLVGALAILYGVQTARPTEQAVGLVAVASAVGIVYSGDFVTLFIFWELLTIATSLLILLNRTQQAYQMGLRFLTMHLGGGLLLLLGILQHYSATGSLEVAVPEAGLAFFIVGIGFKAAFLPIHLWVAWGYPSASFSSSVVLAGLTTKIGVFAIARILPDHQGIAFMGACMAVFGFTVALLQKDMRRLLSYHIISQVGYMVAAAGLGTAIAVDGSMLHMVNHMLYKALLFMCAGAVIYVTGTGNLHELHHGEEKYPPIWQAMPLVTLGALVGALAISGFPPFNGFVSKYLLKNAMYGMEPMETMLLIASVGTPLSFCKLLYFGFFNARAPIYRRIPKTLSFAILTTATLCLFLGIQPHLISDILPYGSSLDVYSWSSIRDALVFVMHGVVIFILLRHILEKGVKVPAWLSIEQMVFKPISNAALSLFCKIGNTLDRSVDNMYMRAGSYFLRFSKYVSKIDGALEEGGGLPSHLAASEMAGTTQHFTEGADRVTVDGKMASAGDSGAFSQHTESSHWTIKNINFDNMLMALVLGVILVILIYFGRV